MTHSRTIYWVEVEGRVVQDNFDPDFKKKTSSGGFLLKFKLDTPLVGDEKRTECPMMIGYGVIRRPDLFRVGQPIWVQGYYSADKVLMVANAYLMDEETEETTSEMEIPF